VVKVLKVDCVTYTRYQLTSKRRYVFTGGRRYYYTGFFRGDNDVKIDLTLKASENGVDKVEILWSGEADKSAIHPLFNELDGMASNLKMGPTIVKLELE